MQQIYDEASEDPDWVERVCLSLLAGVGPYFMDGASVHHVPSTMVARAARPTSVATQSVRLGKKTSMVQPGPAVTIGPSALPSYPIPDTHASAPVPAAKSKTYNLEISPQISSVPVPVAEPQVSQQISSVPVVVAEPQVQIYSYAGVSFTWQPTVAVTFASLPTPWACIAMHESSDMVQRSNPASSAQGAFQIEAEMWAKYKLPSYPDTPNQATLAQQYHVALRIFQSDGFAMWQTHTLCGV